MAAIVNVKEDTPPPWAGRGKNHNHTGTQYEFLKKFQNSVSHKN